MRAFIIVPLCFAAGCSGAEETPKAKAAAVASIDGGQWEVTTEVTAMRASDKGAPAIQAKAGDKSTDDICLGEADRTKPPPQIFVGDTDTCKYDSSYTRNGMIQASLRCTREGLQGEIMKGVDGSFTATSFDTVVTTKTYLASDGDVEIDAKVTGRRTGDCAPGGV